MLSGGFADLMAPGLFDVIKDKYKLWPEEYSKIFNVKKSTRQYEQSQVVEGIAAAPQKNEGASVNFANLTQGYKATATHKTYAQGARVTREAYDDDLYSVFKEKLGTYLARSVRQRMEVLAANVFNNGFTAGATAGPDGVALFSTVHPFRSGGTYSNALAVAADLSSTSMEDMLTLLEGTQEANSINIQLIPKTLLVAPAGRWTASVLLESALKPGVANNDKNALLDLDLSFMVDHFLTDSDAWFVLSDSHSLIFWERQAPKLEADDDFDTGDAKVKLTSRASTMWEIATGVVGTPGA
jgi:hypothetical protein